jgi:hypothetical protein
MHFLSACGRERGGTTSASSVFGERSRRSTKLGRDSARPSGCRKVHNTL